MDPEERSEADRVAEKVLRGETTYTKAFTDGDSEQYIEDGNRYGASLQDLIPEGVAHEDREKIMHRLDVGAKARTITFCCGSGGGRPAHRRGESRARENSAAQSQAPRGPPQRGAQRNFQARRGGER